MDSKSARLETAELDRGNLCIEEATVAVEPTKPSFQLADYGPLFTAAEATGVDAVLVGGQAAYFWATQYRPRCPALDAYLPYTSKDADYSADVAAALKLASALNSQFQPAPQKGGMRGLCLGRIPLGGGLQVEILGQVNGVKKSDVIKARFVWLITARW